jgi:cyclic pyranopterin phosphate synthase
MISARNRGLARQIYVDSWRRRKSAAFHLATNSTGRGTVEIDFGAGPVPVYNNANLSIYSGQSCNARCPFCVEELRPSARGTTLVQQKIAEPSDIRYFASLERILDVVRPLGPSVSVTGGEPSKDPRLPGILRRLANSGVRKRTVTTNGSGLLDLRENKKVIDWITATRTSHLNISIAHPDSANNARIMGFRESLAPESLAEVIRISKERGTRVRLSCVLLRDGINSCDGILDYLKFARSLDVDNVIFRQLMKTNCSTHAENYVVKYSDRSRVQLEPLLDEISHHAAFLFQRQVLGYYYYVEIWKYEDMDVVFEEADLAQLELTKKSMPGVVHELVFHPSGSLASTWQPWDGVLIAPHLTATQNS